MVYCLSEGCEREKFIKALGSETGQLTGFAFRNEQREHSWRDQCLFIIENEIKKEKGVRILHSLVET